MTNATRLDASKPQSMESAVGRRREALPIELILLSSGIFGSLALSALSAVLPDIQASYQGMPNVAYWTKAIVTIDGVAMAAAPFTGFVVRWLGGPRRTLIACYSLFLVAGLAGAFMTSLYAIIFTRFLVGLAGATLITLAITLIADRHEGRGRELRIGLNHALGALLIGLLVPFAGWLGDLGGWRWAFAVHLIALPYIACAFLAKDLDRFRHEREDRRGPRSSLLRIIPVALLASATGSIALGIPIFLPFHVREIGVPGAAVAGGMFTLMAGTSVFASASFGVVRRFLPTPAVFVIAFALWATGLAITGAAQTLPMIMAGVVVIGCGGGLVQPCLFSLVASISAPPSLPRNNGLVKGCFYSGPLVGTTILQALLGQLPASHSLFALGGVALTMAAAALLILTFARRGAPRPGA
jgi:MFS family permease